VLHTDQQHPHVHLVVKAEGNHGRRLHIDKPMLRAWREDFARIMRERLAIEFLRHRESRRSAQRAGESPIRDPGKEFTR
jgi:hypothetical protein